MSRIEQIAEGVTLYLGDCRDIMPAVGKFDAVVTDPPYGIGINKSNRLSVSRGHGGESWDDQPADMSWLPPLNIPSIVWGGNYFDLPPHRAPLVWDKNNAGRDFADFEMAWTNLDMVARRIVFRPMNMDGGKLHPTQKPIEVMRWCVSYLPRDAATILDPFMGSGTTGVAAVMLGRKFIGIEASQKYFDIACMRVEEATRQPDMLVAIEKKAIDIQQDMLVALEAPPDRETFATIWTEPYVDPRKAEAAE
jgi:site-specific DNA-methyltransferase (adenine-specific)